MVKPYCYFFFVSCPAKHLFDIQRLVSAFLKYSFTPARLMGSDKPFCPILFHGHLFLVFFLFWQKRGSKPFFFFLTLVFSRMQFGRSFDTRENQKKKSLNLVKKWKNLFCIINSFYHKNHEFQKVTKLCSENFEKWKKFSPFFGYFFSVWGGE